jgi:hypothetical protein
VLASLGEASRFNGFPEQRKPLKRLLSTVAQITGLKAGVNETS